MAAARCSSSRTGPAIRRATTAATTPPSTSVPRASSPSSSLVLLMASSMRRQVPGQDLAAPVELADDGVPLALLDDDRDGGHEQAEEEYRTPQQLGLQRVEPEVDAARAHGARSSRMRRSGM